MSDSPELRPAGAPVALAEGGASSMADGGWHRMHPLTPLFQGGLVLLVVAGIAIGNLRDHLIYWFVAIVAPGVDVGDDAPGDPVDWVLRSGLIGWGLLAVLLLVVVLAAVFWVLWRFHQFRITGDDVEVRKGLVFRTHRRAPLDRVQGVNLTRPFPARLIGMAKLEVVGAGTDANVSLEYLATRRAEEVRADILRLASGARAVRQAARDGVAIAPGRGLVGALNEGVAGIIDGVDHADLVPESVVKIPTGRLIGSQAISGLIWLGFFLLIFAVTMAFMLPVALSNEDGDGLLVLLGAGLGTGIPLVLAAFAITWTQITRSLRYAIAPTPDGVRVTFGLFTTVTETLPPGRIFAVEVTQSLLWRPFGWWTIKINRMSGQSAAQQASGQGQQFNTVLPVGTRADVERVLALILPDVPAQDLPLIWDHGMLGPVAESGVVDPYTTMPRRAWWRRPVSWRRHGYALTGYALLLRRGRVWRKLAVFPLARLQGVSIAQGPIDRLQRVAWAQAHSVTGPVSGQVVGLDRGDALDLLQRASRAAVAAAAADQSHRWLQHLPAPDVAPAPASDAAMGPGAAMGSGAGRAGAPEATA
ncbi:PH domain-containing protein [Microbacterium sp. NPDC096154]|uniref:PH domain-containing protein n=1 Tax=Microbacterium sp. NPDC096154 TaxID=3155549 RepID=UPI00332C3090